VVEDFFSIIGRIAQALGVDPLALFERSEQYSDDEKAELFKKRPRYWPFWTEKSKKYLLTKIYNWLTIENTGLIILMIW